MTATSMPSTDAVTTPDETFTPPSLATVPQPAHDGAVAQKQLVIINWSSEYDRLMPTLIMATTAAASGLSCKVFITFWGLLPFVKDQKRITGFRVYRANVNDLNFVAVAETGPLITNFTDSMLPACGLAYFVVATYTDFRGNLLETGPSPTSYFSPSC